MATTIVQQPKYNQVPVGSDIVFTLMNNTIVATELKVKFIAEVHISSEFAPNLSSNTDVIGVFKTTPNNAGVGMFDLSAVVESYVKADNLAYATQNGTHGSEYKEVLTTNNTQHPIHLIDKYSGNRNTVRYLAIRFKIEYLGATDSNGNQDDDTVRVATGQSVDSSYWRIFNGYLKATDKLRYDGIDFGYFFGEFNMDDDEDKFLTNAPLTQYANIDDYGTFPFFNQSNEIYYVRLTYYDDAGSILNQEVVLKVAGNGADIGLTSGRAAFQIMFLGCFPANLRNWSAIFDAAMPDLSYYTIRAFDSSSNEISEEYTIHINCPDLKGYESIRLTWLNQWGCWDYYTFNKKSTRSISTSGSTYTQMRGTWNYGTYQLHGYKGGKKAFRVNAVEKIKMNTDFVSEAEGPWFEELINSPEVYILNGFQDDFAEPLLNTYVTPVRLTTSSYTKKTVANDKLMQYTFEVEKAKTLRTQSI
jgi:hypothetical protein